MIDSTVLGQTAARCMEALDDHRDLDGGAIEAVLIVVVARNADDSGTWTRVFSSENQHYKQRGLVAVAEEVLTDGEVIPNDGEDA